MKDKQKVTQFPDREGKNAVDRMDEHTNPSTPSTDMVHHPDLFEGMTAISAVLDPAIRSFNNRRVLTVFVDKTRMDRKTRELAFLRHQAKEQGFTIEAVRPEDLAAFTSSNTHGGIAAVCSDRTLPDLESIRKAPKKDGFYVLLDGIEDPYNFGYTLRSLYAAGADGVILPPRNWMGSAGLVARSSAGTSEKIPLYVADPSRAVDIFKSWKFRVACAGIRNAVDLREADLHLPLLLVIGGEKRGISRAVLDRSDLTVRIGYRRNFQGSLSSAASAAILAFEIMRQNES